MVKVAPDENAVCPHCKIGVRYVDVEDKYHGAYFTHIKSPKQTIIMFYAECPICEKPIIKGEEVTGLGTSRYSVIGEHLFWPQTTTRNPLPTSVPDYLAQDYHEAALVLPFSPKASAALSRRCLQIVLREAGNTKSKDLSGQIDEILSSLPSTISQNLDAIRAVGNFAAHPIKSQSTGEIIEVEPGEAEWNLDVLDSLFDFYYERPEIERRKRIAINQKLAEAGKPPLKQ
jgi:hypothetical protein